MEKPLYCFPVISAINASRETSGTNGRMVLTGVRALVVDDEPMNLIVAKSIFGGYGMTVETAESGPESIEMCQKYKYDIVFMDHMMPGMDGVEAMKRIRGGLRGKAELPIVALTANTVSQAREMFVQEGFDGFVGKPIETTELERTLKNVLPADKILYVQDEEPAPETKAESKPKPAPESDINDPDHYKPLRVFGLDDSVGLRYCQGDHTLYQAILADFAQGAPDMVAYLDDKLANGDMKGYEIKIHSIKSTSRMVGALELGDVAERLEKAAKEEDIDTVRRDHNQAITLYTGLTEAIKKHG